MSLRATRSKVKSSESSVEVDRSQALTKDMLENKQHILEDANNNNNNNITSTPSKSKSKSKSKSNINSNSNNNSSSNDESDDNSNTIEQKHVNPTAESSFKAVKETGPKKYNGIFASLYNGMTQQVYAYELETALYMLDPWEKCLFNGLVLTLAVATTYYAYGFYTSP